MQFLWVPFKRFLLYAARRSERARELVRSAVSINPGQLTLVSCDMRTGGEFLWSIRGVVNHFRINWNKIFHPEWLCGWGLRGTNLTHYVLSRGKLPYLYPMPFFLTLIETQLCFVLSMAVDHSLYRKLFSLHKCQLRIQKSLSYKQDKGVVYNVDRTRGTHKKRQSQLVFGECACT